MLALVMSCATLFSACGGGSDVSGSNGDSENVSGNSANSSNNVGGDDETVYISAELDEKILSGLDAEYAPKTNKIQQMEGAIDVAIIFEDTLMGWDALAKEYMRLHSDAVAVQLISKYSAAAYAEKATTEISDPNTDWDIVQGNVINAELWPTRFSNMQAAVYGKNAYAGNYTWTEVLNEDAYVTDKSGMNTDCYIMNSINLNTGWFVNEVALQKAFDAGYVNAEGKQGYPVTWDDLIGLCAKLQALGYTSPLGISVDEESATASQFTWLLRVYGDYYYRNEYDKIDFEGDYEVDLTATNPESNQKFNLSFNKLLSTILDTESSVGYVGAMSDKFKDFVSQIGKIKPYLNINAGGLSFDNMRDSFFTQTKASDPQIILDYVGSGLKFSNLESENFKAGLFDYPTMLNEYVPEETITRDVGGNGGYLSIVKHDTAQNKLNLDFMKFVMSPYGQTVYYNALSANKNFAPQGLTTVRNDLIKVPEAWTEFFNTEKVTFTGLSDSNRYVEWMIRGMSSDPTAMENNYKYWKNYLVGKGSDAMSLENFSTEWHNTLFAAFPNVAKLRDWHAKCYLFPNLEDGQVDHDQL